MCKPDHRSQCYEKVHSFFPKLWILAHGVKHLRCALRVPYVSNFTHAGLLPHKVDLSWGIVVAHFLPRELPICFVFEVMVTFVAETISCAPLVSKPDIVPGPC